MLVLDIGKTQSPRDVRKLRKGKGRIMRKLTKSLDKLRADNTIEAGAKVVVVVVRQDPLI